MTAVAPARPARRRLSPFALCEALATPHGVERYLELVNPMLTVRDLRAEVTDVHRSTADTVTLTLRPTRQWRGFQAGQFVQVTVEIDGVRRTRCYSPARSQHRDDGRIELTIKAHPGGGVSQFLHANAAPGLVVGAWYVRQMMGSANITGRTLFHTLSGNLSHQIEHHLFPDIPPGVTRRSRPRYRPCARSTDCPTTPDDSPSRSARPGPRSSGWLCRSARVASRTLRPRLRLFPRRFRLPCDSTPRRGRKYGRQARDR